MSDRAKFLHTVRRNEWSLMKRKGEINVTGPAPFVVIHHTCDCQVKEKQAACFDREECKKAMRYLQEYHMNMKIRSRINYMDIVYQFTVGSDGTTYEGRGWGQGAAHSGMKFTKISVGIALIGKWTDKKPPAKQLKIVQDLIDAGVKLGYIKPDYRLIGHRQIEPDHPCPGDALNEELKTWKHYSKDTSIPAEYILLAEESIEYIDI